MNADFQIRNRIGNGFGSNEEPYPKLHAVYINDVRGYDGMFNHEEGPDGIAWCAWEIVPMKQIYKPLKHLEQLLFNRGLNTYE